MATNQISLSPSSVVRALGAVACLLVATSIGGQLLFYFTGHQAYGLVWLFDVDAEQNIPTGFSALLLLFAALYLAVTTVLEKKRTGAAVLPWATLSLGFLCMAFDEAFSFHEKLNSPVQRLLSQDHLGVLYFAWVVPGIALVLVLAPLFVRFLLRLPVKTRNAFLVAATLFVGGAIGVEAYGGSYAELHGYSNLTYNIIANVEESLEMGGVITFIWALHVYVADVYKEVRFRFA